MAQNVIIKYKIIKNLNVYNEEESRYVLTDESE